MQFTLWTDDVELAAAAARAGVSRVGPDLEIVGKRDRQPEADNLVSGHTASVLPAMRAAIGGARLHVRSNPVHLGLQRELEACLDAGVTSVMLPMVRSVSQAQQVLRWIRGRAETILMVEHADALAIVDRLAALDGVAGLYVGANDLARSLGMRARFSVLGSELIERVAEAAHRRGVGFGFFGIGRPDDEALPVPSDLVYAEQVRLGATLVILARSFGATPENVAGRLEAARLRFGHWRTRSADDLAAARERLRSACAEAECRAARRTGEAPGGPGREPADAERVEAAVESVSSGSQSNFRRAQ
jgi:2-keto-3-deoxy-L-rhamnonate aldolase RhmA